MQTVLNISGMHCGACVQRLTRALEAVPGVQSVRVTLDPPRAEVEAAVAMDGETLRQAVANAGDYRVVDAGSNAPAMDAAADIAAPKPSLYPLVLIVAFITAVAAIAAFVRGDGGWHGFMLDFMAGFFLVFSFFKLLDVRGFAGAYAMYDVVASRWRGWGLVYPFVELGLGVAYLVRWQLAAVNIATLVLMLVGAVGVVRAVARKDRIRCACLGTALNLPMTTVTIVEDVGMAAMAAAMLLWRH